MKAWIIDAADILDENFDKDVRNLPIIKTASIDLFLDDNDINFIVAPKGFGKTLLLLYKRLLYHGKPNGRYYIPATGNLVDIPKSGAANLDWGNISFSFFKERRNWEVVWRTSISVAIIKLAKKKLLLDENIYYKKIIIEDKYEGFLYPIIRELITEIEIDTPLEVLNYILGKFNNQDLRDLIKEQEFVDKFISNLRVPFYVFIDNIDEYFEEHLEKEKKEYSPSSRGIFDSRMWYLSQQSLIFAATTICKNNHHIKVFAAIRKAAFDDIESTMKQNIRSRTISNIVYSEKELKEIFISNIKRTSIKYLANPALVDSDPIKSFIGFDTIINAITNKEENLFRYILRHTLNRPRDLINIGKGILEISVADRNEKTIREKINNISSEIANDYFNVFVPHTYFNSAEHFKTFLKTIPHNILNFKSLHKICSQFNHCNIHPKNCTLCRNVHVFCEMHKLGLLGNVRFDLVENKYKQIFSTPGKYTYDSKSGLISSKAEENSYFLVHPILNEFIGGVRELRLNTSITIGHNLEWKEPVLPDFLYKNKIFISHSKLDIKFVKKLIRDFKKFEIPFWYDEDNIMVGDSIIEAIESGIKSCEYLGIIISRNSLSSGWVKKELKAGIIENIEKGGIKILPILIDDVWSDVPFFIKDIKYADFINDYEEGLQDLFKKVTAK